MLYPRPTQPLLREWQKTVDVLCECSVADHALLRVAYPTSLEILVASPGSGERLAIGERDNRDRSHFCEEVLDNRQALFVSDASAEARWDATVERRTGLLSFAGVPLVWPDSEVFGTLELLGREPMGPEDIERSRRLLDVFAASISAQLELLYRTQQHQFESTHDPLTGLANQSLFAELSGHQIKHSLRNGGELWLLLWCIDGYEDLIESSGSTHAEAILRASAERAKGCIRQSDILARMDENVFALLVSDANEFVASAVADRIRRNTHRIKADTDREQTLTLSCGTSRHLADDTLATWIDRSRMGMMEAQRAGGDQVISQPAE